MMSTTKQRATRMHSLELKGRGMERPISAGVHFVTADGLAQGVGSATHNPDPLQAARGVLDLGELQPLPATRQLADDIVEIIAALDPDDEQQWTKAGPPKVAVLEAALGFQITEADRDNAWQLFNQRG